MLYLRSDIQNHLCYGFHEKLRKEHVLFFLCAEIRQMQKYLLEERKKNHISRPTRVVWGQTLFTLYSPHPLTSRLDNHIWLIIQRRFKRIICQCDRLTFCRSAVSGFTVQLLNCAREPQMGMIKILRMQFYSKRIMSVSS